MNRKTPSHVFLTPPAMESPTSETKMKGMELMLHFFDMKCTALKDSKEWDLN